MVSSITNRDYPVILGLTALIAVVVLAFNLFLDILFGFLDPKITYK
jgi:peptide/nickel transport system permease protein